MINQLADGKHDYCPDLDVEILGEVATHDVAAVELMVTYRGDTFLFNGHAKRDPRDKSNPKLGLDIAYARALGKAARKLERRAQGLVKHADDLAATKQAQRERVQQVFDKIAEEEGGLGLCENPDATGSPHKKNYSCVNWKPVKS